jgi:hypothetical protein
MESETVEEFGVGLLASLPSLRPSRLCSKML